MTYVYRSTVRNSKRKSRTTSKRQRQSQRQKQSQKHKETQRHLDKESQRQSIVNKKYVNELMRLYPACKHDENRYETNTNYSLHKTTYGEMDYVGIEQLFMRELKRLHPTVDIAKIHTFMDIGSGRGKLCLWMAAQPSIKTSIGVELVKSRHEDAVGLQSKLSATYPEITEKVVFLNENVLMVDLKSMTKSSGVAFVWFSNLCFDQEVTNDIFQKLARELPKGSFICCSKQPSIHIGELLGSVPIKMSWMDGSQVFVYQTNG